MKLIEIFQDARDVILEESVQNWVVSDITADSREVREGSLFFAVNGAAQRGEDFIAQAIASGAKVIVLERPYGHCSVMGRICHLFVKDIRRCIEQAAVRFFHDPSKKVKCLGITGTNGKTTITYLLQSICRMAQKPCGIIGTICHDLGDGKVESRNTTPGVIDLQKYLSQMADRGLVFCAMEVSSHALDQGRVAGICFDQAIFTNLTSDHLDYHKNRENYFSAKAKLFRSLSSDKCAVINRDDPVACRLIEQISARCLTYGLDPKTSQVCAQNIRYSINHTVFDVVFPDGSDMSLDMPMIGIHNVYNVLAAAGSAYVQGIEIEIIKKGLERCSLVKGRLEAVSCGQDFSIFIDYAHTEDALRNVLTAIRNVSSSRLILVFGCGGDRDKTKRPKMGEVACELADFSIVTSDNPRSEDPRKIIEDILPGFSKKNYCCVLDRREAIAKALAMARSGDIVLLAGKGHETYQILKTGKIDFDERHVIREILDAKS